MIVFILIPNYILIVNFTTIKMRIKSNIRLVTGSFLLLVFLQFLCVKAFHSHGSKVQSCTGVSCCDHSGHSDSEESSDDNPSSCQICQYTLSPFTEVAPMHLEYIPVTETIFLINSVSAKPAPVFAYVNLRAPPVTNAF